MCPRKSSSRCHRNAMSAGVSPVVLLSVRSPHVERLLSGEKTRISPTPVEVPDGANVSVRIEGPPSDSWVSLSNPLPSAPVLRFGAHTEQDPV